MDDAGPYRSIIALAVFIIASGYFASVEIAFTSVSRVRLQSRADNGNKRAKKALYVLDHFDKALSTILIGNNIMHIGSATLATLIATRLWGQGSVTASSLCVTALLFLFGEMLPKAFAKDCTEAFTLATAPSLDLLMKALTPVSFVFTQISNLISRPFRKGKEEPSVTEDELQDIIENVVEEGALDEDEGELVQNAFEFDGRTARDVMTPWDRTVRLPVNTTPEELAAFAQEDRHSRIPIVDAADRPIAILIMRRYLTAHLHGRDTRLRSLMVPAHYVRADMPIDDMLPDMSNARSHMAVVLDRGGKALGVVTVEDVLEELVGEIYDEDETKGGEDA